MKARSGSAFGYGFIALGLVWFLASGTAFNGLWLASIGWFLVRASRSELGASTVAARHRGS
jgi:hypothetical protein